MKNSSKKLLSSKNLSIIRKILFLQSEEMRTFLHKKFYVLCFFFAFFTGTVHSQNKYEPSLEMLEVRKDFQDQKFGMFIHWGISSMLADGEWVMQNKNINVKDYKRLLHGFYPSKFNADEWVLAAKNAGMKYIIFITRHHDGFSNWDTKYSDWKITNSPYKTDVLKLLAEACKKHGMKLGLYYSLVDWYRDDYPFATGATGQNVGRDKSKNNYDSYLQFMKNQITELLTNYGDISAIWFDGFWDQVKNGTSAINWKIDEVYSLIHQLQPLCLIGNNHHEKPIPGEDFQMFERDFPGENKAGLSTQKPSDILPIETCETLNGSWGFNIKDNNFKSKKELISLLVGAAGRNANLLLNVGPMPTGEIQPECIDKLKDMGAWLRLNAESIYGTRSGPLTPQVWGVTTQNGKKVFVHFLSNPKDPLVFIPGSYKVGSARFLISGTPFPATYQTQGVLLNCSNIPQIDDDIVITLEKN